MVTPPERLIRPSEKREGRVELNPYPFYCSERTKEKGTAAGISCIMQALTAAQLLQILSVVSTSVTNDAKCIMSG